eukprot:Hpha_TRINITY_DN18640_c0_g1::TRINITY_DN18640_c0_g1_i1::g.115738::m.115738/K05970/SIAE; sialate O-acetylesterase
MKTLGVVLAALVPQVSGLIEFGPHVQDHMVLQRAPSSAAVYGTYNGSGTPTITARVSGSASYTVEGKVWAGNEWSVKLKAAQAGGRYTITVDCDGCTPGNNTVSIEDVTFGDVWYCGGQSNMALPLVHTISRNESLKAIQNGEFNNIRLHQMKSNMNPDTDWTTVLNATKTLTLLTMQNMTDAPVPVLFSFSATCFYFAQELTRLLGKDAPPIGLIHTAWGGSTAEQWTSNATSAKCRDVVTGSSSQEWFDTRVMPFSRMTVKGWTWYQGENDMGNIFGNSAQSRGYACEVPAMIAEWREVFSGRGSTSPNAPFGIVTLAHSGSEGHPDMGGMYAAQMGSYGVVPNPVMPNTFMANAFDLGDPFGNITCYKLGCCPNNIKPGAFCHGCDKYCTSLEGTNYYMGPIHPRDKLPVGQRLAKAAYGDVYGADVQTTGPVISGCTVSGGELTIKFNAGLLGKDTMYVGEYQRAHTASMLQVLTNASLFCVQIKKEDGHDTECLDDGSGREMNHTLTSSVFDSLDTWPMVNVSVTGASTLVANISRFEGKVFGLRYGWYGSCCSLDAPTSDPCPIASCPLKGSPSMLPVNPFIAKIVDGKCKCLAPQVCDE